MDQIAPEAPPESAPPRADAGPPFRRPADYYSAPDDNRPRFPRWVPFGCGTAAIVALVLVFAGGIAASRGGMGALFDLMFSSIQGETDKMFARDVTPAERAAFDSEMKILRQAVRENRLPIDRLQPLLRSLRDATEDERVTAAETERLIRELRDVNRTARK